MKSLTKVLCLVFVFGLSTSSQVSATTISAPVVISEINQVRAEAGLESYHESLALTLAALRKGIDMYVSGHLGHISVDGRNPGDFVSGAGYKYQTVGENLGFAYSDASSLVVAMLNSPAHRDNLLSNSHTDIGVALLPHPTMVGEIMVVMLFASPL